MTIIGYIHICQEGDWQKPFDLIMNSIKNYGLFNETVEIRCGIVSNSGIFKNDTRFDDPKIKIIYTSTSNFYERKTLEHMRQYADIDSPNSKYWYAHTKVISHFGKGNFHKEKCIIDWINLLNFWNFEHWRIAVEKLNDYDTYGCSGCNIHHLHYSGNFWWARASHVKTLPLNIGQGYTDPEFWICINNNKMYNIFTSGFEGGGHYNNLYPQSLYKLPNGFSCDAYRRHNKDLAHLNNDDCVFHWYRNGINENRKYDDT